jgi:hypothetical protein
MSEYEECRSYAQHLFAEHRRLHQFVTSVREAMLQAQPESQDQWSNNVLPVLRQMREELARHFLEEEQGGCMEEAASYLPRLSPEVERIKTEHPALLERLDRLIAQAAEEPLTAEDRGALGQRFSQYCQDLHAHEAEENKVLQLGFATDINGEEQNPPPSR